MTVAPAGGDNPAGWTTLVTRVLVIGGGGREHALIWALRRSAGAELLCAPGNGGIAGQARCFETRSEDVEGLVRLASRQRVDLTVVGPEQPLANGLVDAFEQAGLPVIGPGRSAAQLESSKSFAKLFMGRHGIPTAPFEIFDRPEPARAYLAQAERRYPLVIKADGLAAGKGVVVAEARDQAEAAVSAFMERHTLGAAGEKVVIEECLAGEEASYILLWDGETHLTLPSSQDHKRVFDGDRGPNTGGMGAYSPTPVLSPILQQTIETRIVAPTLAGLAREQLHYRGFLYIGLMLTEPGPQVLEFNVRLGDPEAQVILPRLSSDLLELLQAAERGQLASQKPRWRSAAAACVVLASDGYPGAYRTGLPISGLERAAELDEVTLFHAATRLGPAGLETAGGRVLAVTGCGPTLRQALGRAYEGVRRIHFSGCHYRSDIGARGMARSVSP